MYKDWLIVGPPIKGIWNTQCSVLHKAPNPPDFSLSCSMAQAQVCSTGMFTGFFFIFFVRSEVRNEVWGVEWGGADCQHFYFYLQHFYFYFQHFYFYFQHFYFYFQHFSQMKSWSNWSLNLIWDPPPNSRQTFVIIIFRLLKGPGQSRCHFSDTQLLMNSETTCLSTQSR